MQTRVVNTSTHEQTLLLGASQRGYGAGRWSKEGACPSGQEAVHLSSSFVPTFRACEFKFYTLIGRPGSIRYTPVHISTLNLDSKDNSLRTSQKK